MNSRFIKRARHRPAAVAVALLGTAGVAWAVGLSTSTETTGPASSADVMMLVLYITLALVFSFLCSVAEAVLLSITPSFIAGLEKEHPRQAALIRKLKQENVDRSLAAILTLNTIAHTVGAIGSGAKATAVFGNEWFGVFSAVMTLMILFLSEIIPKTLGAVYWRRLAGVTAIFVRGLIVILYPLIFLSELLTKLITRGKDVHAFSREEFAAMARVGEMAGHIDPDESRIIHNLLRFGILKARDVMTPRTVIVGLEESGTVSDTLEQITRTPFSRVPLYHGDIDHVTGFVLRGDLLLHEAKGQGTTPLKKLCLEIKNIPASMPLSDLLEFFLSQRTKMAIVKDEYGGTMGLVTLEDTVETLLGMEIVDEADHVIDMQAMARKKWEQRAKELGLDVEVSENMEPLNRPSAEP